MDLLKQTILEKKQQRLNKPAAVQDPPKNSQFSDKNPNSNQQTSFSIDLTQPEIIFRLRKLKQPAILFGETIEDQYKRLKESEKNLIENRLNLNEPDLNLSTFAEEIGGDLSIYLSSEYLDQARACKTVEDGGLLWKKTKHTHPFVIESNELTYAQKTLVVFLWWNDILNQWKEKMQPNEENKYKLASGVFKKFLLVLKTQVVSEEVLCLYFQSVRFCQIRNYVQAHNVYLEIFTVPKFYAPSTASVAKRPSEESFKKYAQNFKRIMTLSQIFYPTSPSNTVFV